MSHQSIWERHQRWWTQQTPAVADVQNESVKLNFTKRKLKVVKEDTFHFQDDRIRIPFRDMTTSEAEYHAETMWPYYDEKISTLLEQKTKMLCLEFREDIIINQMNQMFGINLNDKQEKEKIKRIFQLFRLLVEIQQRFYNLLNKVFVPWALAASTGLLVILIKQYFPDIRYYIEKLEQISK